MLFKSDDGFKLWGTVPSALFGWDDASYDRAVEQPGVHAPMKMPGKRITFTQPSRRALTTRRCCL